MARTAKDVTTAELAILEVLWLNGAQSIRQVVTAFSETGVVTLPATVMKLVERLETKGFIRRDRTGSVQSFTPIRSRDDLIAFRLKVIADELCGGSMKTLIAKSSQLAPRKRDPELVADPERN